MKNLLFISLSCLTFTAYGQTREFANTIKVEDSDSKEVILEKAAHIVPTANQLRSLENEFIAFVHLGQIHLPVWNGNRQGRSQNF